jgi:hypothetical protein
MASKRTPIGRGARTHLTPEAIAAWISGDVRALKAALGLGPWEHSPLSSDYAIGYALPEVPTEGRGWQKCKRFQQELVDRVGWPPLEVKQAVAEKRRAEAEASLTYLRTPMARNMAFNKERHEERIREYEL